ncbi:proteasome beta 5 subunit [Trypanosoma rangeli]|uniref:Proteasome subunit beta n=1 Tax=Trypanosoma rangeli TaxID=5698 RepID=A0A3R7MZI3_TRYRA|nr:proteasome beta 5 subunit [Trypanosoma rangeli]RNE97636.1 proteasome beta 5 subunit [Trypanosoma rangeli]|eukprot:RNE97636.1 proteasome beta 5 subunit [Trypanosoma rangeli]
MLADFESVLRTNFSLDDCPRIGPFTWQNVPGLDGLNKEDEWDTQTLSSYSFLGTDLRCNDDFSVIPATGEKLTEDPLNTLNRLQTDMRTWKLMRPCPVPRSIPKIDMKKGTTTLGFHFDGGIIIAVDSRASSGQYISSQTVMKVLEINEYLLGTMAGGAADCQYWERVLGMECRLWELRNNCRISVAAASKILANITYSYRNHGLSMGTMVAGWDQFGPSLYYVDDKGTRVKHELFSVGSGSIYAYGVLDQGYRKDLTVEQACDLARRSIFHATYRDGASGGIVTVYHVHQGGWTRISRDDQTKLYDLYVV